MQPPVVILHENECLPQAETMGKKKDEDESDSDVMRKWAYRRRDKLTPERRKEIAAKAARARWAKARDKEKKPPP